MSDRISQLEAMANDPARPAEEVEKEEVEKLQREARMVRAEAARLENQRSSLLVAEADAARQPSLTGCRHRRYSRIRSLKVSAGSRASIASYYADQTRAFNAVTFPRPRSW